MERIRSDAPRLQRFTRNRQANPQEEVQAEAGSTAYMQRFARTYAKENDKQHKEGLELRHSAYEKVRRQNEKVQNQRKDTHAARTKTRAIDYNTVPLTVQNQRHEEYFTANKYITPPPTTRLTCWLVVGTLMWCCTSIPEGTLCTMRGPRRGCCPSSSRATLPRPTVAPDWALPRILGLVSHPVLDSSCLHHGPVITLAAVVTSGVVIKHRPNDPAAA